MKITAFNDEKIVFSDGSYIVYDHCQDCCEWNYADFSILSVFYGGEEFDKVSIEPTEYGFLLHLHGVQPFARFDETKKIYIPCYSDQNGYYSWDLDVYLYNNKNEVVSHIYIEDCAMP